MRMGRQIASPIPLGRKAMDQPVTAIADTLARLGTGTADDILDQPGIECQCLDLAIKRRTCATRVAGPAFARCSVD